MRGVPGEDLVFSEQDVYVTVACQVYEFQIWVPPVNIRRRSERTMRFPSVVVHVFKKARRRPIELDQIGPAVSSQIQELHPAARDFTERGLRRHGLYRSQFGH